MRKRGREWERKKEKEDVRCRKRGRHRVTIGCEVRPVS